MLKPDRHALIVDLLHKCGSLRVSDLVDIIITDPGISAQNVKTVEGLGIDLIIAR